MGGEVRDAVGQAEHDQSVVGIVLTGAGRGFCAGADMNRLSALSGADGGGGATADERARPVRRAVDTETGRRVVGRGPARRLHVPPLGAQADRRRDQRPGRRHGRADRPLLRPAVHERGDRAHHLVRPAWAGRRVGPLVAAHPARRSGPRPRPAVLGATCGRRRGRPHRLGEPGASRRRGARRRPGLRPRARPHVVAHVDGDHEAAGVHRAPRRPRRGRTQRHRADEGELRATRLRRRRRLLHRAPRPEVPAASIECRHAPLGREDRPARPLGHRLRRSSG